MKLTISKSKNSESFYISKSFIDNSGKSTTATVRKLGTLSELIKDHGPTRDDVIAWCRSEVAAETKKYKQARKTKSVQVVFHADKELDYAQRKLFEGGYLFPQAVYYKLQLDKICKTIKQRHQYEYDLNATQSIKKLDAENKKLALSKDGFKRLADNKKVSAAEIESTDSDELYYKKIPYISGNIDQLLIITYSPKYAAYQKAIREAQVQRAEAMINKGKLKKNRKNPNDPARFIWKDACTEDGEVADIHYYLDETKVAEEAGYDGLYAVCTDLIDDDVKDILKVSEGRWQIEECFRIMKTDFAARPVYIRRDDRIEAHFLICFLSLLVYRLLEKQLENKYTCEEILDKLKSIKFADIKGQGYMPTYIRDKLTDALHKVCGFRTDYEFITKADMRTIEKQSKQR